MDESEVSGIDPTDEERLGEALFRYGIIAHVVQAGEERVQTAKIVLELTRQVWKDPSGQERRYSERTMYNWIRRYREEGLRGLLRKRRSDRGTMRAFSKETLDRLVELRKDQPHRSTPTLLDILRRERKEETGLARSTVNRHLDRVGQSRRRLGTLTQKVRTRILNITAPNQLWVADLHDGPKVIHPERQTPVRSHLSASIDHFSRLVPFGAYYVRENLPILEDSVRRAVGRRGCPDRFYVDNARIYHSTQFKIACLRLGAKPPTHSKPYDKESRGVIERFFQTVKHDFETEVRALGRIPTLAELNEYFQAWLEEKYHHRIHSETGQTPLERFAANGFVPRFADPDTLSECFRVRAIRLVDRKTATISINAKVYGVDPELRGRKVDVLFDPFDPEYVVIYFRGERVQRALQKPHPKQEHVDRATHASQVDYLDILHNAHKRRLRKQAADLCYDDQPAPGSGFQQFSDAFKRVLKSPDDPKTLDRLRVFWHKYGPVDHDLLLYILGNAVALGEVHLHVSHYLEHIRVQLHKKR